MSCGNEDPFKASAGSKTKSRQILYFVYLFCGQMDPH